MKTRFLKGLRPMILGICVIFLFSNVARAQDAPGGVPSAPPLSIQDVAARLKPALVRLRIIESSTEEGREARIEGHGSGALISPDGFIVTNHHVAGMARAIYVTLSDQREVEGRLVGTDPLSDLAVVKIEGTGYATAQWGDDKLLRVGDPVLALGSPHALSQSVTAGIVSNLELTVFDSVAVTLDGEDTGSIVRWIAHDAPIFPGNSGGPLVNARGEMVGVNEMEIGLSGAIPASLARPIVEELIAKGSIKRAYTGLALQPRLAGQGERGVLVAGVLPGSPAQKAGIAPGDLILSARASGETQPHGFDAAFAEQLPAINNQIGSWPVGESIEIQLERGGALRTVSLAATPRPRAWDDGREVRGWDITASDISTLAAIQNRMDSTQGALVTGVVEGGAAASAQPPLEEGDVVVALNRQSVANVAELQKLSEKLPVRDEGALALVEVTRGGERILSAIRLNRAGISDASVEVKKAWLPVSVQAFTPELATLLKVPGQARGVRVTRVLAPNSSLLVGDLLVSMDGAPIEVESSENVEVFWAMVREYNIGTKAKFGVVRAGKRLQVAIKLGAEPRAERELPVLRDTNLGLSLREISYWDRARGDAGAAQKGVSITEITPGGWAEVAGIHAADLLLAIDGQPTPTLQTAQAALANLAKQRPKTSTFFIAHRVNTQFHEVKTPWGHH